MSIGADVILTSSPVFGWTPPTAQVEKVFKKHRLRTLSSLLEFERSQGIHRGSELHEHSAAMGLLWIRRYVPN